MTTYHMTPGRVVYRTPRHDSVPVFVVPDDDATLDRMVDAYYVLLETHPAAETRDRMRAALAAATEPARPDEPQRVLAVVRDGKGVERYRTATDWWSALDRDQHVSLRWVDLPEPIEILHEGWKGDDA